MSKGDDLILRASAMADCLGDGSWRSWTDEQAAEVEATMDQLRDFAEVTLRHIRDLAQVVDEGGRRMAHLAALLRQVDGAGEDR